MTWWHLGVLRRQKLSLTINYFLCLFNYSCFFTNTPSKTSSSRLKPLRQYIYWVLRDLMSTFFLKSLFSLPPDSDSESFLPLTNLMNTLRNSGKTLGIWYYFTQRGNITASDTAVGTTAFPIFPKRCCLKFRKTCFRDIKSPIFNELLFGLLVPSFVRYLTNKFHVAVRLSSDRLQITSTLW